MNWEHYSAHQHPFVAGEGFWTDVNYNSQSFGTARTKAFIGINKKGIESIGYFWFVEGQRHPEKQFYFFMDDGAILADMNDSRSIVSRDKCYSIPAKLSDHLIGLATSFRETYPEYKDSLDKCVKEIVRKTEKPR